MISLQIKSTIRVLIIGCGDIGLRVARLWQAQGAETYALSHTPARQETLADQNITPLIGDLDQPPPLPLPTKSCQYIYYFAPPPVSGQTDPRMQHFLSSLDQYPAPEKIIYISTSAIYGDQKGALVDESATPNPKSDRGYRRLDAETQLLQWCTDHTTDAVILRVGGIYGPGRLPLARLKQGLPVLNPALAPPTNRIHADDLAQVCFAAALRGEPGIYNAADGQRSSMSEYFITLAQMAGLPPPEQINWQEAEKRMSKEMLSYLTESRQLDTSKLRTLGIRFQYPDLVSGLKASLEA